MNRGLKNEIRVDHEFETKIPPLTEEEFRNLEKSILTDGEIISPNHYLERISKNGLKSSLLKGYEEMIKILFVCHGRRLEEEA